MSRIALIANPAASDVTPRRLRAVRDALAREHKVDLEITQSPGHATALTRDAVGDGAEAIVIFGGDGTLSETYPVLCGTDVPVGVLPGGGTNVAARTFGMPVRLGPAVEHLMRCLWLGPRRVGLATANGTPFAFVAGMGFDAATVALVSRRRRWRRWLGDGLFVASAVQAFARADRRQPALSIRLPDGSCVDGLFHLMVSNSSPYTYMGRWPMTIAPGATMNRPLAVTGFRSLNLGFTLRMLGGSLRGGRAIVSHPQTAFLHDVPRFEVRAHPGVPLQADGEPRGEVSAVTFAWRPEALSLLV